MDKEYRLIMLACLTKRSESEQKELDELFTGEINWEKISGQVVNHRLSGYFYNLISFKQKDLLPKEFMKILELITTAQKVQTLEIMKIMEPILKDFEKENVMYAGLKGILFNASLYSPGYRRSNDTDLLVNEANLEKLDIILRKHGYVQSFGYNGFLKEATRKEKIIQRMNNHDLVPYLKIVDNDFVKRHEIDINFQFDSVKNEITDEIFNEGTKKYSNKYCSVMGLPWETNLLQLCVHFYREATSSLWTDGRRDVVLYKVIDVINFLRLCENKERILNLIPLIKKFNLEKAVYYTMSILKQFYEDEYVNLIIDKLEPMDKGFLDEIYLEKEKRIIKRSNKFCEEAFNLIQNI